VAYQGTPANIRKGTSAGGGLQRAVTGFWSLGDRLCMTWEVRGSDSRFGEDSVCWIYRHGR